MKEFIAFKEAQINKIDRLLEDMKEDILITKDSEENKILREALVMQRTAIRINITAWQQKIN